MNMERGLYGNVRQWGVGRERRVRDEWSQCALSTLVELLKNKFNYQSIFLKCVCVYIHAYECACECMHMCACIRHRKKVRWENELTIVVCRECSMKLSCVDSKAAETVTCPVCGVRSTARKQRAGERENEKDRSSWQEASARSPLMSECLRK